METLKALHQESKQLLQQFQKLKDTTLNRTQVIEQIHTHIEKREKLLAQIKGPYSEDEIRLGKKIIKLNEEIQQQMDELYEEIKNDLKQIQGRKKQNYSYINPYKNFKTVDGIYLDRKS